MPLISDHTIDLSDNRQSENALVIRRGVFRGTEESDWVFVPELTLANGRRADLIGVNSKGTIRIIEIKSSVADFRSDQKWQEYLGFCDEFFFATLPEVPLDIFPDTQGLILADKHGCEIVRDAELCKLSASTRKAVILKIARISTKRLMQHGLMES